jgi:cytosine/adenosine deaminase-related metal-dependent hydrolase
MKKFENRNPSNMNDEIVLTAAWLAPMDRPPLRDGAVVIRGGRVAGIGSIAAMREQHPSAGVHEFGDAIILPGLVNAHTHLELSSIVRGPKPARFVDWIIGLMCQSPAVDPAESVRAGIDQCLRFGVTAVGDITSQPGVSRPVLSASPLRGVSFGEVRAMAQRRSFLEPRIAAAIGDASRESASGPGISPHAPYSIEIDGYQRCLAAARDRSLPLATHLAETSDEAIFLAEQSGPFRELWDFLGAWDDRVPRFTGGPIRFAKAIGLVDYPSLLAHVNYCDDAEMQLLAEGIASVVYCPRTHLYFGHPAHRWREMILRGINVAVGTDSCASSPDLNLVEEIRLLHAIAPEIEPVALWDLITARAARAIGRNDCGRLSRGCFGDAVVFRIKTDDPLVEIMEQPQLPMAVWIGGRQVQPGVQLGRGPETESARPGG